MAENSLAWSLSQPRREFFWTQITERSAILPSLCVSGRQVPRGKRTTSMKTNKQPDVGVSLTVPAEEVETAASLAVCLVFSAGEH